jgi:hypothetical protein
MLKKTFGFASSTSREVVAQHQAGGRKKKKDTRDGVYYEENSCLSMSVFKFCASSSLFASHFPGRRQARFSPTFFFSLQIFK